MGVSEKVEHHWGIGCELPMVALAKNINLEGGLCTFFLDERINWGGGKHIMEGGGGPAHNLLMGETIGLGTPKNIERKNLYDWWVGDSFRKYYHFVAPSSNLIYF